MKCHHSIDDSHVSQTPHLINPSLYLRTTTTTTRPSTFSRFARHSASFFRSGDPRPGNRNILTPFATSLHA
jgi:hypothetical protein